jgi:hypothetical protein
MQKKFKTIAITIPFLLFMSGEPHALAFPGIVRGEAEPRPVEQAPASPVVNKTAVARKQQTAKAIRKRPRGLERMAKRRQRRKSRRNSTASVAARRLYIIKREYTKLTNQHLVVTSFVRTPAQQAHAIRNNIRRYGMAYVLFTYRYSPAIHEIADAYRPNRQKPQEAQRRMTVVIQNQIARGVYVSAHLRGQAVDIRSRGRDGAHLHVLRNVARGVGAKVSVEADHFHLRLV